MTPAAEFDATLDEFVDVHMRMALRLGTYQRQRRHSQLLVGGVAAVCLLGGLAGRAHLAIAPTLVIGVPSGVLFGWLAAVSYGRFNDRYVKRAWREAIDKQLGGGPVRCQVELRQDELSCATPHHSVGFPWTRLTEIRVLDGDVEFWFDPGLVVVRARAFPTTAERDAFIRTARERSGKRQSLR